MHAQHLLRLHALYRNSLANSSCLLLNLLGIAKELAFVFVYIKSLDDTDLLVPFSSTAPSCTGVLAFACCSPFLKVNGGCVCVLYKSPYTHPFGNLFYEIFISMFSNVHVLRNNKQYGENI